jgi:hypothetical protein
MNQSVMTESIINRAMGVLQLNDATYEEIEHDTSATTQAAIIVIVAGIAAGIGAITDEWYAIFVSPIAALISWVVGAYFIYLVGTRVIPSGMTEADLGQVLRLLGFAAVTGIANVLGFIPVLGAIVALVAGIWGIVITVKAIMHALEMSVLRAIATAILAFIVQVLVLAIIGGILGVGLLAFA